MRIRNRLSGLLLAALLVLTMLPTTAFALSGTGTYDNPIIITTYEELRSCMANPVKNGYYKLGNDIIQKDNQNAYGIYCSKPGYVYLDLNGHKLSRTAMTTDTELFVVSNGCSLWIRDSGSSMGSVSMSLTGSTMASSLFLVYGQSSLTVTGGYFEAIASDTASTNVISTSGDVTIKGGIFTGSLCGLDQSDGNVTIEYGSFYGRNPLSLSSNYSSTSTIGQCVLYNNSGDSTNNLIYYGGMESSCSRYLKDHVASDVAVWVDGSRVSLNNQLGLRGTKAVFAVPFAVGSVTIHGDYTKDCTKLENVSCTIDGVNVPATVEVKYIRNKKSLDELIPGASMEVGFYVTLPDGYVWSDSRTSSWNGAKPEAVVKTSTMTDSQRCFIYDVTVPNPGTAPYVFPFVDVPQSQWYYEWVKGAHQMGLINGKTETTYCPNDNMTYAEAIKLAACMHQKYTTGSVTLTNGSPNWYDSYVDYCMQNGIITQKYASVINSKIDRQSYAAIFAKALPAKALSAKNTIPDGSIPDVSKSNPNYDAIYTLYRAGIVNGSDSKGSFNPSSNIKRSEVAAILMRMMDESVRVGAPADLST